MPTPQQRCTTLTPVEADALFFPGPGGKPHKAELFCSGCPTRSQCLKDALAITDLEGFYCGTTSTERASMRRFTASSAKSLQDALPAEPIRNAKKSPYLIVNKNTTDHNWLDEDLEPSLLEVLQLTD